MVFEVPLALKTGDRFFQDGWMLTHTDELPAWLEYDLSAEYPHLIGDLLLLISR